MRIDVPGWAWGWAWGWGWAAAVASIIILGIFLLPWFLFLLSLQSTLNRVSSGNRAMPSGYVWLNFIPIFNLGWFIFTVMKVRDSVRNEYASRGWPTEGDFGYNVGLAAGILAIAGFVIGWLPVLGWGVTVAMIVCWIVYWLKIAEFKNRLGLPGPWQGYAPPGGYRESTAPYSPPGQSMSPRGPEGLGGSDATPAGDPAAAGDRVAAPTEEATAMQCAACGAEVDPSDRFCRRCGTPRPGEPG